MRKLVSVFLVLFTLVALGAPLAALAEEAAPAADAAPALAPDPSGGGIGAHGDIMDIFKEKADADLTPEDLAKKLEERYTAAVEKEPLAGKLMDVVGHNKISINFVWTLICGFLVMFMQAGFALAETGFTRAKNAGHTMAMNFMVYGLGMLGYWVCGFALQMGGAAGPTTLGGTTALLNSEFTINILGKDFGLFGTKGFFLMGDAYDGAIMTLFLFQMVFMDTTATIPTGTMAERWTFKNFFLYAFFISGIVYPIYANWVWGGGWLAMLGKNFALGHGTVDFAGSSVVHMTGGVAALAGGIVIGPRIGKYKNGKAQAMPGHHIPMAVLGCLILGFGWFGFNAGSTLAGTDLRIGVVATNTMLASAAGALSAAMYMWFLYGKPDISMAANGFLAALVAITAPCAFVTPLAAVTIGVIAGVLLCMSVFFVENVLKIDDPVGAISVHGVNGAFGLLCVGIFADGTYGDGWNTIAGPVKGVLYGDGGQLAAQLVGIGANFLFVFVVMLIWFKISDAIFPIRVKPEQELEGLDMHEVAVLAYPEFTLEKTR